MKIKNLVTGKVLFSADVATWGELVGLAVKQGANLEGAYLEGAYLEGANLKGAYLYGANLKGAYLYGANLKGAYLYGANLEGAYLEGAYLEGANLKGANLKGAYLYGANLKGANLYGANLEGAYLYGANLKGANLEGANLEGAYLEGANLYGANLELANLYGAKLHYSHIPEEGSFVGWKKLKNNVIAKLEIPAEAKRTSSIIGRKNRAEFVKVLELFGAKVGVSKHDEKTQYRVGELVYPDSYNGDPRVECTNGIHFFITRKEAEEY